MVPSSSSPAAVVEDVGGDETAPKVGFEEILRALGPVIASCVALTSAMISKTIASTVIDAHAPWRGGKGGRSYGRAHDAAMALQPRAYGPEGSHS